MTDITADSAAIATPAPAPTLARIATLDIVRGIAVMGILAMNIVAFAGPFQAYMNPTVYGAEGPADIGSWIFSFVLIDGKMRGLFSFLFGASTLLVIERAEASGESPAKIHYLRMVWLLLFGLIHFYFIWFGDILSLYALCGLLLFFFRKLSVRALVIWGVALVVVQTLLFASFAAGAYFLSDAVAQGNATADQVKEWREMQGFVTLTPEKLQQELALHLGPWSAIVRDQFVRHGTDPFTGIIMFGWETVAYMLFGMAALKSGFFRGEWETARYRRIALLGFGLGIPAYAVLAWLIVRSDFAPASLFALSLAATVPFRPLMIVAIGALIILLTRNGGALVDRIAAAGRAAFTNYLGTSLIMTTIFYGYGFGLFGSLRRIEMWIPVLAMWALMLLWSKPWLDRYRYGPFEWLWRSLSRFELQPMRKGPGGPVAVVET
jgi:uncharacterized protein